MTEPELIAALTNSSVDARAVLAVLSQYVSALGDVTLTLSNGTTYTIPSIQSQRNTFQNDRIADQLSFSKDYGGIATQTITRNVAGLTTSAEATYSTGFKVKHDYTYSLDNLLTSVSYTIKNALDVTLETGVRNIARTNGRVTAVTN